MNNIPVVDLSPTFSSDLHTPSQQEWKNISEEIRAALHGIGFVYLINHGLDQLKIERAFQESKTFFEQPIDIKVLYKKHNATKGYHGGYAYNEHASGEVILNSNAVFELRESFDFAGKRGFYPENNIPNFHPSMLTLENECHNLIKKILRTLGIALQLEEEAFFLKLFEWIEHLSVPSFKTFRSLYYPAIPIDIDIPEGKHRVKEHSDFGFFTLLFQDSIGGLEVKTVDGNWIQAAPIPGAILLNVGDMLDIWTGGYFPATKHRVLIPKAEIKKRTPRQSIVYFVHPDSSAVMAPLSSQVLGDYNFTPIAAYEHAKVKLAAINSY